MENAQEIDCYVTKDMLEQEHENAATATLSMTAFPEGV